MYEKFGAAVSGKKVEFQLFFPDNSVNPGQYGFDASVPHIKELRVAGNFQHHLGSSDWDAGNAPVMKKIPHSKGMLYRFKIPGGLPEGFYEYKYFVTFENGTTRWCTDPCAKLSGDDNENSAFVVGGNDTIVRPIKRRLQQKDLVIYEVMLDDFVCEFIDGRAPFDAFRDKLDYLAEMGINAIEFMPWTAWYGDDFNWGYAVFQFFSVEHHYVHDNRGPLEKLFRLKTLINELHSRRFHIIMDSVFNHAFAGEEPGRGFAYYWLYQNPFESPYTGTFARGGFFQDLDFRNICTQEFIFDVARYWVDTYKIDGLRFDYTIGYFTREYLQRGIIKLCEDLKSHFTASGRTNFSMMLEHLTDNRYEAIDNINQTEATGCWFDPLMYKAWDVLSGGALDDYFLRALNTTKDFAQGKCPVTYIENHDHTTIVSKTGGRNYWWRTQPWAIALLTLPGTVMLHNGQEFGEDYWFPEEGSGRVMPRPLHWALADDAIGVSLRALYAKLIHIRHEHPALRSANFFPDSGGQYFDADSYGPNRSKNLVIYHRWGEAADGALEKFIIVLNFSNSPQWSNIPFPVNGQWNDLLNGGDTQVTGYRIENDLIPSNWGKIYYQK